ncbi:MAG: tetratricopeptide repeat protein [Inquilinus sp.]|nr:tetratricopeptide repeat protein [Inquilinus sp.]
MSSFRLRRAALLATVLSAAVAAGPVWAAGDSDDSDDSSRVERADPDYRAAETRIGQGDYQGAIALLEEVAQRDPQNADAFNYLGYANRKLGHFEAALGHYRRALELEPRHRGAHEYLGELYLQTGKLVQAEELLASLDRICFFGCEEYDELKEKVEAYKAGRLPAG